MKSRITASFRKRYSQLPEKIRQRARAAYRLFKNNPNHPSLRFKQMQGRNDLYSVRIGLDYRALGVLKDDTIYWFWIGSHEEYDKLL
jgi:mRNA-degrading endonuclease RelE of RelBE toxin-antitoxin system